LYLTTIFLVSVDQTASTTPSKPEVAFSIRFLHIPQFPATVKLAFLGGAADIVVFAPNKKAANKNATNILIFIFLLFWLNLNLNNGKINFIVWTTLLFVK
jgi:hypothetical protein